MKIIVFILVLSVLISLLICLIALTKYLNFDRKIKEAQAKQNPLYELNKALDDLEKQDRRDQKSKAKKK